MIKSKKELYEELKTLQTNGQNIYVGNLMDIKSDSFDTEKLCIANFAVTYVEEGTERTHLSDFKYVFEKIEIVDMTIYREIFSNSNFGNIACEKTSKLRGMHVADPILYDDYISSLHKNKTKVREL